MAVSSGTSRVCVNEEKYEPATIRGLPADLVKKSQEGEMKDLDDINVLEWVEESTVPRDAPILDCGWAMRMKSPSAVRARVVSRNSMICTHRHPRCGVVQHVRCESGVHACSCFRTQVCENLQLSNVQADG